MFGLIAWLIVTWLELGPMPPSIIDIKSIAKDFIDQVFVIAIVTATNANDILKKVQLF